ncbi:MAG: hypothetical protein C6I00_01630 [Nitratiruptor sp.]|nr:hypothetical protein [Nitratiruptor sp.]NPA83299.1 hypothetical protein [Campylobacterota bacterium]
MRSILLVALLVQGSFAITINELIRMYKEQNYYDVCMQGVKIFNRFRHNEDLVSMYAFSCLYSDKLNRLAVPLLFLGKTQQSRQNRAYLSLILAQKNILVSALVDGIEFEGLNVPNTDYVLSRVFNLYFKKRYEKHDNSYILKDSEGEYKLYVKQINNRPWVIIEETRPDGKRLVHKYR